ncbi:MAG: hypothetical protein LBG57_11695 [Treponema sp.]|jgi:vacuolar-type H+-ATPase subunit E/Vma4|nr:hypothetical protein [Treponema sp.]
MEELQSTEILDREILEDARKKAYRILKAADETVKAASGVWEKKIGETLEALNEKYAEQRKLAAAEILARLPMDRRRAKAEKIESLLRQAVETWYEGLGRDKVLSILKTELEVRLAECAEFFDSDERVRVLIHKIERAEAGTILKAVLPGKDCVIEETPALSPYPEIILDNRLVRISASIHKTVDFLLREKRAELIESLLGTAALNMEEVL